MNAGTVLHVVTGTCGDYSSRELWSVAGYLDRATAEKHAELATAWRKDQQARFEQDYEWEVMEEVCPFDDQRTSTFPAEYYVSLVFVHHDPMQYQQESTVLMDHAKVQGWIP